MQSKPFFWTFDGIDHLHSKNEISRSPSSCHLMESGPLVEIRDDHRSCDVQLVVVAEALKFDTWQA